MLETLPERQIGFAPLGQPERMKYDRFLGYMRPKEDEDASRACSIRILTKVETSLAIESNLINPMSLAFWPRWFNNIDDPMIKTILSLPRYIG
ncbi:MAG: hypothetical protein QG549_298 [Patescibacteria group bacterium]|jgi:hypothetical protein|nr:hypothetical protein [Patescibacteria group bacterium]